MKLFEDQDRPGLETLATVIAHSQIVVAQWQTQTRTFPLPAGFDQRDRAILDWIAAEGRRVGRGFALM